MKRLPGDGRIRSKYVVEVTTYEHGRIELFQTAQSNQFSKHPYM
jgi:hypothetical protein